MNACIAVKDGDGKLLRLFSERRFAHSSIEYSYHKIEGMTFDYSEALKVRAVKPDGTIHVFDVQAVEIFDHTCHL